MIDCSCGGKCECWGSAPPGGGMIPRLPAAKEWVRKGIELAASMGLTFRLDPGDGGFYNAEGRRVAGSCFCERHTYEVLLAESLKP